MRLQDCFYKKRYRWLSISNLHGLEEKKSSSLSDLEFRDWLSHQVAWSPTLDSPLLGVRRRSPCCPPLQAAVAAFSRNPNDNWLINHEI